MNQMGIVGIAAHNSEALADQKTDRPAPELALERDRSNQFLILRSNSLCFRPGGSVFRQNRRLYGCWPLKGAFSLQLNAKATATTKVM